MTQTAAGGQRGRSLVLRNFARYAGTEVKGAFILLLATIIALILANSPLHQAVSSFWETGIEVAVSSHSVSFSLRELINDALMTLFFLVVGIEIKRELLVGELSVWKKALLPIFAAIGGMVVPAAIYLVLNLGTGSERGWGIPMATDIAFAIGVTALLGRRVPQGLKVFLVSLAIVDDLGAILVIAIAYTSSVSWPWLTAAVVPLAVLLLLTRLSVDNVAPYAFFGIALWICVLLAGIHSTIAGVVLALAIPSKARTSPLDFATETRQTLAEIEGANVPGEHVLKDNTQQLAAMRIRCATKHTAAPLQRMEFALHPWTTFLVLPLFALANAGVRIIDVSLAGLFTTPLAIGVIAGLVVGKPLGIVGAAWIAQRLRLVMLPAKVSWAHMVGAGILGGVGFTMSIFITGLAFGQGPEATAAKTAVICASIAAGILGYVVLRSVCKPR